MSHPGAVSAGRRMMTGSRRPDPTRRPTVSIVTITLNDPVGIRRTVASVQAQDSNDHEHVVVDGGSGSEVVDWLREWEAADPERRRLVTDPPPGIFPSMNVGIRESSAPLVLQLMGGDELTPGAIHRVVAHHAAHDWPWAYGGIAVRDTDGRPVGTYAFDPFRMLRFRAGLDNIPHPAAYVTRRLHDEIGLYREDVGNSADQEFFLRAAATTRPANIPGMLAVFHLGGVSGRSGFVARERAWHRHRCSSGTAFGGSVAVDAVVAAGLVGVQLAKWAEGRIRRDPYPFLDQEPVPQQA